MKHHVILKNAVYANQKMATSEGIIQVDAEGVCKVSDADIIAAMKASGWEVAESQKAPTLAPEVVEKIVGDIEAEAQIEAELEQSGESTDFDDQPAGESEAPVADEGKADKKKNRFSKK